MSLPCIKFFTYTISYFIFLCLVLLSSLDIDLNTANEKQNTIQFSVAYSNSLDNYTDYIENTEIEYRFAPTDFFIRQHTPNYLDIAICIYLLGNFANFKNI